MAQNSDYGPKISSSDFDRQIVELHSGAPSMPSRDEDRRIRRVELNLVIDHRLGTSFPKAKRDDLWRVMESVEKKRLRMALSYGVRRLVGRKTRPKQLLHKANLITGSMIEQVSTVLSEEELMAFFDLTPGEPESLPLDKDHFQL